MKWIALGIAIVFVIVFHEILDGWGVKSLPKRLFLFTLAASAQALLSIFLKP